MTGNKFDPFLGLITSISSHYNIDRVLICAICEQESFWNPYIVRYEPAWTSFMDIQSFAKNQSITIQTEAALQMTSWGLMQIMGAVARELGFSEMLTKLTDPAVGIEYGAKKLRKLLDYYGNQDDAVSSYNQGNCRKLVTGNYANQDYVDKVNSRIIKLREIIK